MPVKDIFRKMQPLQLYVLLTLTIVLSATELVVTYFTHSMTLLMDSYNMLCNVFALAGCIATIKYGNDVHSPEAEAVQEGSSENIEEITLKSECQDKKGKKPSRAGAKQEKKLKNTFGWTRIDVITMLICCVFSASFCFSVYVEAFQTLGHIDHKDAIHYPIPVLCIGAAGLILNGLCYLLIGGYTFHQGSFLYLTESGDVVLNKVVVNDSVQKGDRRLSRPAEIFSSPPKKRQGLWETARDITGCTLVMLCAIIVIFTEPEIAKFADPILALVSATCIVVLSYPYIKESCRILLQTMPDTINIDLLKKELVDHFPDIINVHDFHIWQLTTSKVISTVHIIFENPKIYRRIMEEIKEFFLENGVTQVTIQPEFFHQSSSQESLMSCKQSPICLVACQEELCKINHCCPSYEDVSKLKSSSSQNISQIDGTTPTLKSIKVIDEELRSIGSSESTYSLNSLENMDKSVSNISKNAEENKTKEEKTDETKNVVSEANNKKVESPAKNDKESKKSKKSHHSEKNSTSSSDKKSSDAKNKADKSTKPRDL